MVLKSTASFARVRSCSSSCILWIRTNAVNFSRWSKFTTNLVNLSLSRMTLPTFNFCAS